MPSIRWDFRQILDVYPELYSFTCVGTTRQGKRCFNKRHFLADLNTASCLLDIMDVSPLKESYQYLCELAESTLCQRWQHQAQSEQIALRWERMIKEYAKDLSRERERLAELRANIQLKKMRLATLELKALLDEGSEENVLLEERLEPETKCPPCPLRPAPLAPSHDHEQNNLFAAEIVSKHPYFSDEVETSSLAVSISSTYSTGTSLPDVNTSYRPDETQNSSLEIGVLAHSEGDVYEDDILIGLSIKNNPSTPHSRNHSEDTVVDDSIRPLLPPRKSSRRSFQRVHGQITPPRTPPQPLPRPRPSSIVYEFGSAMSINEFRFELLGDIPTEAWLKNAESLKKTAAAISRPSSLAIEVPIPIPRKSSKRQRFPKIDTSMVISSTVPEEIRYPSSARFSKSPNIVKSPIRHIASQSAIHVQYQKQSVSPSSTRSPNNLRNTLYTPTVSPITKITRSTSTPPSSALSNLESRHFSSTASVSSTSTRFKFDKYPLLTAPTSKFSTFCPTQTTEQEDSQNKPQLQQEEGQQKPLPTPPQTPEDSQALNPTAGDLPPMTPFGVEYFSCVPAPPHPFRRSSTIPRKPVPNRQRGDSATSLRRTGEVRRRSAGILGRGRSGSEGAEVASPVQSLDVPELEAGNVATPPLESTPTPTLAAGEVDLLDEPTITMEQDPALADRCISWVQKIEVYNATRELEVLVKHEEKAEKGAEKSVEQISDREKEGEKEKVKENLVVITEEDANNGCLDSLGWAKLREKVVGRMKEVEVPVQEKPKEKVSVVGVAGVMSRKRTGSLGMMRIGKVMGKVN